jgi:hypothetical protein
VPRGPAVRGMHVMREASRGAALRAACIILGALSATPALAECRVDELAPPRPGTAMPLRMYVRANTPCLQKVSPHAEGAIESGRVTRQPRHGRVGLANNNDFAFAPDSDFVGRDSFEVTLVVVINGQRETGRFRFDVEVVP